VLKGIDRTFEKWKSRKRRTKMVNSLAYCAQEVLAAAGEGAEARSSASAAPPFTDEELAAYLRQNAAQLRAAAGRAGPWQADVYLETADALEQLAAERHCDLEALEQRLTVLEERIKGASVQAHSENELFELRREMERQLAPYRSKMNAEQLVMLQKQYLDRRVMEAAGLPRLSLFYL
jgi:hypothetical protein